VTAKVLPNKRSPREHLRRLSVLFAVELQLKIVAELYSREMSPTQFYNEFGGGSPSRVAKNFRRLRDEEWLRHMRDGLGPSGRIEGFYRAPEPAFFDAESWALVPYSLRVASSRALFNQIAPVLRNAMEERRSDEYRDLSCTTLLLDEAGWTNVIGAIDAQFVSLFEHQSDSRFRVAHTGEELIRADVFLIGFELPLPGAGGRGLDLVTRDEPLGPFHERLSPAIADEMSLRIVQELNLRPMSAARFHRAFGHEFEGASYQSVLRRFKRLEEVGWLARVPPPVHQRSTEHFYRATIPVIHDNFLRPNMPDAAREPDRWLAFEQLCGDVKEAMQGGTFDARTDRYVTWAFLALDRQAWDGVILELDALLDYINDEQRRAVKRLKDSGDSPIAMNIATAAYESPKEAPKAH
jgi:hypothetical protein